MVTHTYMMLFCIAEAVSEMIFEIISKSRHNIISQSDSALYKSNFPDNII